MWRFDFLLNDVTKENADRILDIIITLAEALDAEVYGGFSLYDESEADDG